MATPREIALLANRLGDSKLININASLKDHVDIATDALGPINPADLAGWYVAGGDHYVVVCGIQAPNAASNPAAAARA